MHRSTLSQDCLAVMGERAREVPKVQMGREEGFAAYPRFFILMFRLRWCSLFFLCDFQNEMMLSAREGPRGPEGRYGPQGTFILPLPFCPHLVSAGPPGAPGIFRFFLTLLFDLFCHLATRKESTVDQILLPPGSTP